jgi:RNA polymerase sigma-70 factor, ECF subfamily
MSEDPTRSIDLVRQAQKGDAEALNRLFERYYERVRRIVRLRLGRELRSSLESGDILQETFSAAVLAFERFEMRDEASLINWLSKLAERQILAAADHHGAKKRDRKREVQISGNVSQNGEDSAPFEVAAETRPPLEKLSDGEQTDLVECCVRELDEEYRELIILRDYAGASWEAVAEQTGRPSAAAARMMHARALIELGRLIRKRGVT